MVVYNNSNIGYNDTITNQNPHQKSHKNHLLPHPPRLKTSSNMANPPIKINVTNPLTTVTQFQNKFSMMLSY